MPCARRHTFVSACPPQSSSASSTLDFVCAAGHQNVRRLCLFWWGPLLVMLTSVGSTPNIVLMVADDMGFADNTYTTAQGVVQTPNLDVLATAGVRLRNHHVQPVCSPTRATLLTGRHVLRYGLQNTVIWPQDAWALPKNETTLAQNLKDAGYATAAFGKVWIFASEIATSETVTRVNLCVVN